MVMPTDTADSRIISAPEGVAARINMPIDNSAVIRRFNHVFVHKSETGERRVDVTEFLDWCRSCGEDPVTVFRELASR